MLEVSGSFAPTGSGFVQSRIELHFLVGFCGIFAPGLAKEIWLSQRSIDHSNVDPTRAPACPQFRIGSASGKGKETMLTQSKVWTQINLESKTCHVVIYKPLIL